MWANDPQMAARWERHTKKGKKLPKHVHKKKYLADVEPVERYFWPVIAEAASKLIPKMATSALGAKKLVKPALEAGMSVLPNALSQKPKQNPQQNYRMQTPKAHACEKVTRKLHKGSWNPPRLKYAMKKYADATTLRKIMRVAGPAGIGLVGGAGGLTALQQAVRKKDERKIEQAMAEIAAENQQEEKFMVDVELLEKYETIPLWKRRDLVAIARPAWLHGHDVAERLWLKRKSVADGQNAIAMEDIAARLRQKRLNKLGADSATGERWQPGKRTPSIGVEMRKRLSGGGLNTIGLPNSKYSLADVEPVRYNFDPYKKAKNVVDSMEAREDLLSGGMPLNVRKALEGEGIRNATFKSIKRKLLRSWNKSTGPHGKPFFKIPHFSLADVEPIRQYGIIGSAMKSISGFGESVAKQGIQEGRAAKKAAGILGSGTGEAANAAVPFTSRMKHRAGRFMEYHPGATAAIGAGAVGGAGYLAHRRKPQEGYMAEVEVIRYAYPKFIKDRLRMEENMLLHKPASFKRPGQSAGGDLTLGAMLGFTPLGMIANPGNAGAIRRSKRIAKIKSFVGQGI
jgi:hypothetical protein